MTDLNPRRGESDDTDPGPDVAGDPELDPIVDGGVPDEIESVGLQHVEPADADLSLEEAAAVGRLREAGHGGDAEGDAVVHDVEDGGVVADLDLVGVFGGEEEGEIKGEVGGGLGGGRGDEEVGYGDLVEVERGLFGADDEDDDEGDGDGEEDEEGEEEEEAAAAALEGGAGGGGGGEGDRSERVVVVVVGGRVGGSVEAVGDGAVGEVRVGGHCGIRCSPPPLRYPQWGSFLFLFIISGEEE